MVGALVKRLEKLQRFRLIAAIVDDEYVVVPVGGLRQGFDTRSEQACLIKGGYDDGDRGAFVGEPEGEHSDAGVHGPLRMLNPGRQASAVNGFLDCASASLETARLCCARRGRGGRRRAPVIEDLRDVTDVPSLLDSAKREVIVLRAVEVPPETAQVFVQGPPNA